MGQDQSKRTSSFSPTLEPDQSGTSSQSYGYTLRQSDFAAVSPPPPTLPAAAQSAAPSSSHVNFNTDQSGSPIWSPDTYRSPANQHGPQTTVSDVPFELHPKFILLLNANKMRDSPVKPGTSNDYCYDFHLERSVVSGYDRYPYGCG